MADEKINPKLYNHPPLYGIHSRPAAGVNAERYVIWISIVLFLAFIVGTVIHHYRTHDSFFPEETLPTAKK